MLRRSRMRMRSGLLSSGLLTIIISIGCGGGGMQTPSSNNGSPPSASNPGSSNPGMGNTGGGSSGGGGSTGSGGSSGGSGSSGSGGSGGTGSSVPDSYLATIICCSVGKSQSAEGQITVDTTADDGAGTVQITNTGGNVAANQNLILQFCPYPQNYSNCVNVASFATDSSGKASANFTLPSKGTFAGAFQILNNGNQYLVTASAATNAVNFKSAELPAASVNGGINHTTGNAAGSGSVVVTGTMAHLVLSGTSPSHAFQISVCGINGNCNVLATVASDAKGNVSADVTLPQFESVLFLVSEQTGEVDFISAFRVQ